MRERGRVKSVDSLPPDLKKCARARSLVLGELQYPDPEELIGASIPLLRKVSHKFHRSDLLIDLCTKYRD